MSMLGRRAPDSALRTSAYASTSPAKQCKHSHFTNFASEAHMGSIQAPKIEPGDVCTMSVAFVRLQFGATGGGGRTNFKRRKATEQDTPERRGSDLSTTARGDR